MAIFDFNQKPEYSKDVQHLIDIFNPPPPKYEYIPVPDFSKFNHPKLEEDKYYGIEEQRWHEGYTNPMGEFVPPNQYFHIQNSTLKDIHGNVFKPKWRDTDELMALWSLDSIKKGTSELVYKRREVGATAFYSNQGSWIWRIKPGSHCAYTSGKGQAGISAMFNDKILFSYNNFDKKVLNTNPVQINNSKTVTSLSVAMKVYNDVGGIDNRVSSLIARETSEKPDSITNISGNRALYVYVDEAPLHQRLEGFLGSIFPVINQGPIRTGLLVMAGTVEPGLTDEQIANFKKLIDRSENLRLQIRFLPVWMGMFSKNGWSNKEAGLQWYNEQVAHAQDTGDYVSARNFKMQYPKDEQDIFDLTAGTTFEPDVIEILKHRRKQIVDNSEEGQYKLIPMQSGFDMIPDTKKRDPQKDGGFWMIEQPKSGITYYQAIDGIGSAKKDGGEKGSWIASVIFKGYDPATNNHYEPVCIYFERPQTIEAGYRNIVNQMLYYNRFDGVKEINYETNAATGDHFGTYLEKENLYQKYAVRRKDLSGKGWTNTKKRGTPVNDHTREWQVKQANLFLRKHGGSIRSLMVLNQLLLDQDKNADIRDAFLIFMTSIPNFDKPIKKSTESKTRTDLILVQDGSGRWVYKQIKVEILPPQLQDEPQDEFLKFEQELKSKYNTPQPYQKANSEERERYSRLKALSGW